MGKKNLLITNNVQFVNQIKYESIMTSKLILSDNALFVLSIHTYKQYGALGRRLRHYQLSNYARGNLCWQSRSKLRDVNSLILVLALLVIICRRPTICSKALKSKCKEQNPKCNVYEMSELPEL